MAAALRATCSCVFFAALTDRESAVLFRLVSDGESAGSPLCHVAGKVNDLIGEGGKFRFRSGIAVPENLTGDKLDVHPAASANETAFLFCEAAIHRVSTNAVAPFAIEKFVHWLAAPTASKSRVAVVVPHLASGIT